MRKILLFGAMLLIASCTVQKEEEFENPAQRRYHAVAEEPADADTRVFADSKLRVRWNEGDHISIFERKTYNQEFEFLGDTGDTAGDFDPVESGGYHTGGDIEDGHVYAIYPYDKKNKCDYEGKLTVTFPSTQHYKKDSFGIGANIMVAKTNTMDLRFMHVGGYRTFKLYGDGVSVSSVKIESNGDEYLSGRTDVTIGTDGKPAVSFIESTSNSKSVELVCDTPVALGATASEAVEFWFVLPPGTLTQGFTVTITDGDGNEFTKSTSNSIEIKSGAKKSMPAFEVEINANVATSVAQANALFASGTTSVTITGPLTEDATIVLPNAEEAVTLTLPTTASTSTLTVSYPQDATSFPATLSIAGPEGSNLDIRTPNSTVIVNGVSYNHITSRTAANTCIISEGVSANVLKAIQGGVQVYGTVSQIDLSEQEDNAIVYATGTVTSLLGEDDEEYALAIGVSLNQTSINLNVGETETLAATVAPAGAYPNAVWSSSNDAVATVSANGVVTAIAEGSATITVTTISGGFTASCDVAVEEMVTGFDWTVVSHSVVEPLEYYYSRRWFVSDGVLYCDYGKKILTVDNDSHTLMTTINSSNSYRDWENFGGIWTAPDGNVFICIGYNDDPEHSSYFTIYRFVNGNWELVGPTYGDYEDYIPGVGVWKTNNYVYDSSGSTFYRSSDGYHFGKVTISNTPTYFDDSKVWTSASGTVYYSEGTSHYLFNESGLSWSRLSASGWSSITASDVFIAGSITYWVSGGDVYMFNESSKTWTRIDNDFRAGLYGRYIWSYGGKYYYSDGTINKELKQGGQSLTPVSLLSFPAAKWDYSSSSLRNPSICNIDGNMIWGRYLKTPGTCVWNRLSTDSNPIVSLAVSMSGPYYYMNYYYDDNDDTDHYCLYPLDPTSGLHSSDYQDYGDGLTYYYAQSLWKDRNGVVHYSDDKRVFNDASGRCYYCCDSNGNTNGYATHYRIYDETNNGWSSLIPLNSPMTYTYSRSFWSDGEGNIYYTYGYTQYQLVPKD